MERYDGFDSFGDKDDETECFFRLYELEKKENEAFEAELFEVQMKMDKENEVQKQEHRPWQEILGEPLKPLTNNIYRKNSGLSEHRSNNNSVLYSSVWYVKPKKWEWNNKKEEIPEGSSKLNALSPISEDFLEELGINTHIDISYKRYKWWAMCLFAGITEHAVTQKFLADNYRGRVELRSYKGELLCYLKMKRGIVSWYIPGSRNNSGSWFNMLQDIFNITLHDAIATLASIVGMDFSNMVTITSSY